MRRIEQRIRAVLVEKSAPASAAHGHHIRVGSRRSGRLLNRGGINAMRSAIAQNRFAIGIAANQANARKRKTTAELGEIFRDVVRPAAIAIGLGGDVGERVLRGPHVNHFDMVHNPVAAGEQAVATAWFNGL